MADIPTFSPNPYGNFDPSQWSNPYSSFQNTGIPFPASYAGWPTDSMGNPIQAPPGMTLNSSPAAPAAAAPAAPAAPAQPSNALSPQIMQQLDFNARRLTGNATGGAANAATSAQIQNYLNNPPRQQAPQAPVAPTPAPAANPAGLTSQQYLQLLAHPNRVATPGATVPQAASSAQPGPGMLQSFLANWNPAASGPGSGFQQAFSKALRGS